MKWRMSMQLRAVKHKRLYPVARRSPEMIARSMIIIALVLAVSAIGCGTRIPGEIRERVTFQDDFKTLQESPGRYEGEFILLGGEVISIENKSDYSEIVVLHFPLNNDSRPQPDKISQGRFLIRSDEFLDPAIYRKEEYLTVAGEIIGSENRTVGAYDYSYPIINAERIWIWETDRGGWMPNLRFGIGIGAVF